MKQVIEDLLTRGVENIIPNRDKINILKYIGNLFPALQKEKTGNYSENFSFSSTSYFPFKSRANIKIQDGCDAYCTYCIVPYVRGRERSRLPEDIVREVQEAVAQGYKEVTLLGQNVNSYGKDHQKATFAQLLEMVDKVEGIQRVRYMTSHPKDLSNEVIEVIKNSKRGGQRPPRAQTGES